uniref:Uncharacterized protein n=1 Tax=Glossina pallidipes TaxID=7398 RepID=A0A1B0A7M6_GLOPL
MKILINALVLEPTRGRECMDDYQRRGYALVPTGAVLSYEEYHYSVFIIFMAFYIGAHNTAAPPSFRDPTSFLSYETLRTSIKLPLCWKTVRVVALPKFKITNGDDVFRPISTPPALSSFTKQLTKDEVLQNRLRCTYRERLSRESNASSECAAHEDCAAYIWCDAPTDCTPEQEQREQQHDKLVALLDSFPMYA